MTYISFPDIVMYSENGEYKIVARSTLESGFGKTNFHYRLYHQDSLVWQFDQQQCTFEFIEKNKLGAEAGVASSSPQKIWVHNRGWVVVQTHNHFGAGIFAVSPVGEFVYGIDIDTAFRESKRVYWTSAGPRWSELAISYFFEIENRPFWCIRVWWGERIIIDLQKKNRAYMIGPRSVSGISKVLRYAEREVIVNTLRKNVEKVISLQDGNNGHHNLIERTVTAVFWAGKIKLQQTIPYLQQLENARIRCGCTSFLDWRWDIHDLRIVQASHLSLRRLGIEPSTPPGYEVTTLRGKTKKFAFVKKRSQRSQKLSPDLSAEEVLKLLGLPDVVNRDTWEYDFLDLHCTLQICWRDSKMEITRFPPCWKTIDRDSGLV